MKIKKFNIPLVIIIFNLIVGNLIFYFGSSGTYGGYVDYELMLGMSISCIIYYFLFFWFSNYKSMNNMKLFVLSVLSCMAIIILGILCTFLIFNDKENVMELIFVAIIMGFFGNIIFLPISILVGFANFIIINLMLRKINISKENIVN